MMQAIVIFSVDRYRKKCGIDWIMIINIANKCNGSGIHPSYGWVRKITFCVNLSCSCVKNILLQHFMVAANMNSFSGFFFQKPYGFMVPIYE